MENISDKLNSLNTELIVIFTILHVFFLFIFSLLYVSMKKSQKSRTGSVNILLQLVYNLCFFMIFSDMVWKIIEGIGFNNPFINYAVNEVYFITSSVASALWLLYCIQYVSKDVYKSKLNRILILLPVIGLVAIMLLSPSLKFIFSFDNGQYVRGKFFYLDPAVKCSYLIVSSVLCFVKGIREKRQYYKKSYISLAFYPVPLLLFGIFQSITGIDFNCAGIVVGFTLLYVTGITNSSKESEEMIYSLAKSFDAAFLVNLETGKIRTLRVSDNYNDSVRRNPDEVYYDNRIAYGLNHNVHEDDVERVKKVFSLKYISERLKKDYSFDEYYKIVSRLGETINHRASFINASGSDGQNLFILGIQNVNEEKMLEKEKKAMASMVNALASDYDEVALIDTKTDLVVEYREYKRLSEDIPPYCDNLNYSVRLEYLRQFAVAESDRKAFLRDTRKDVIFEALRTSSAYYVQFKTDLNGNNDYYQIKFVYPGDDEENKYLIAGLRNIEETRKQELKQKEELERLVLQRTSELTKKNIKMKKNNENLIYAVANIVEARDTDSGEHIMRIGAYSEILADAVMRNFPEYGLNKDQISLISSASALHDIGKIMISDSILLKKGKLTEEEFEIMKTHSVKGCELLKKFSFDEGTEYSKYANEICRWHHEKYDGHGYPDGLIGDEIPISAQIVAVADCFDALTSKRPYKEPFTPEKSIQMIESGECGVFSPKILKCLSDVKEEFIRAKMRTENDI